MNIRKNFAQLIAAIGLSLTSIGSVQADISLTYQSLNSPDYRSTILVKNQYIRFENPMAPEFFMLFDSEQQHMTLVDGSRQSYTVLDRETLDSLSEQIEVTRKAIIAELEIGMKTASAEEKAQMADILEQIKSLAQGPEKALVQYQQTSVQAQVNGYNCTVTQAIINTEEHAQLCVVSAKKAGIPEEEMATLESFHHFSNSVHQQLNPGDSTELLFVMNSKVQIPVSVKRLLPISAQDEYQLMQVKKLSIPASAFSIPNGYQQKDIEDAFIVE